VRDHKEKIVNHANRLRWLQLAVLLAGALGLALAVAPNRPVTAEDDANQPAEQGQNPPKQPRIPTGIPQVPVPATPKPGSQKGFGNFSHTTPGDHASFARGNCGSCHGRAGLAATLPGHKSCDKCHNFAELQPTQFCGICHTNAPAMKTVTRSRSFNTLFAHASHERGAGRPGNGCVACHKPVGASQSIPAYSLNTHQMCYSCHTAGSKIGDCSECHRSGGRNPWRGTDSARAEKGFTHVTHGPRQGLSCEKCHDVRPGGQGRQVTSTVAEQHFPGRAQSCATCHNDKPTFGEKDFGDCKKCHKGATFRL
jgi:hypothetical protein